MRRVVITGMGVVAPNGECVRNFWDGLVAGRSAIEEEPLMGELGLRCRGVARCAGFDLARYWSAAEATELADKARFAQLGATAARMALEDAGLATGGEPLNGGVIFSCAVGGAPEMQELYECLTGGGTSCISPLPVPIPAYDAMFLNWLPGMLARRYGLEGPSLSLTTGCTAGLDALGVGFDLVRHGEVSLTLVGAAEAPLNGLSYATLDVIGCLARVDGPVERASRPFDATRAGFVIAEGAAFVVLEDAIHAAERGAWPLAEVAGFASTSNAYHMTNLASDGETMAATMRRALDDARVEPCGIDYLSAHGSSTPQNDLFETNAVKLVFADHARSLPISSTKSMVGHSLSSASLLAVVSTVCAMRHSIAPPTANYQTPDATCDLDYVTSGARCIDLATTMVVASGFGGIHSAAVLRRTERAR